MIIHEENAKSLLRKSKKIDSWFLSRYGLNLYRGCSHNCIYCDGRYEKYQVSGEFGQDIVVKKNAIEVLSRELDPARKRVPLKQGFICVGGGVCDSYQPAEKDYQLTRQALELINERGFAVHLLTKSTLIERDLDLITKINNKNRAIVSISFSSVDDELSSFFEPGVPSATERLRVLKKFKDAGVVCGMFLMPVIPFITDTPVMINQALRAARQARLDYVVFGGLTLKEGRQKEYFYNKLQERFPDKIHDYQMIYDKSALYGEASKEYYNYINTLFYELAKKFYMPMRIPAFLTGNVLDANDKAVVIFEHLDYLHKLNNHSNPYGRAAWSLSQVKEPLEEIRFKLRELRGVGKFSERLIKEILDTGTCQYYRKMMFR